MKTLLTILLSVYLLVANAQTVGEKSNELGYSLAQKTIDAGAAVQYCFSPDSTFIGYILEAPIPADSLQNGTYFYYYHSNTVDSNFTTTTPLDTILTHYTTWLNNQPYKEKPPQFIIYEKQ